MTWLLNEGWLAQQSENVPGAGAGYTEKGRLYRSSGSLGQVQKVEYNGYVFPPALNTNAVIEPIYSETGRHRTGTKILITVDCVLVDQTLTYAQRQAGSPGIPSTDENLYTLRTLLNENGKLLRFELQGVGITAVSGDMTQVNTQTVVPVVADLDKGPKTTLVDWKPITPLAAKVTWQVEAIVADCTSSGGSKIPYYQDFFGTIQTTVDFQGYVNRTISGALTVPTPKDRTNIPTADQAEYAQSILEKYYPRQVHFNRRYDTTLSPDGGRLDFTITDEEIKTDSPWFPGTSEPDVQLTVSSGVGRGQGGFGKWSASLSGSINVNNGVSKVYGFLAAVTLIDYFTSKGFLGDLPEGKEDNEGETSNYPSEETSEVILLGLSFTDNIYSKTVGFSAEWTLVTDYSTLLQATGMFTPVVPDFIAVTYNDGTVEANVEDDPEADLDPLTFSRWSTSAGATVKPRGIHSFVYSSTDMPEVVLCMPKEINQRTAKTEVSQTGPAAEDSESEKPTPVDADKSYLDVDYHVKITKNNQTFSSTPLADQQVGQYEGQQVVTGQPSRVLKDPSTLPPEEQTSVIPEKANVATSNILPHTLRKTSKAKYFVEITGTIARAYFKPVLPYISKIGGIDAYEIGQATTVQTTIGRGTTSAVNGKPFAIYGMAFRQIFAVQAPPKDLKIQDIGGKGLFDSRSDP